MLRVPHFQTVKEFIQRRLKLVVVLPDFPGPYHFHDHREVLFIGRGFIVEIEHQRQQEHLCRLIPKGVLALTALGRGVLEQVRHQPLDVVVAAEIDKRVVAVAFLHVDKVDHLNVVPLGFQQVPGVPQQFALGIEAHKAGVGVHDIGLCEKPRLARAGAAAHQNIEVAPVFASVQPYGYVLRQYLVLGHFPVGVLLPDGLGGAPLGGAVFLPPAVVAVGGEVDTDAQPIAQQKNEDSFQAVPAQYDVERVVQRRPAVLHQPQQTAAHIGGQQQGQPDHGDNAAGVEGQVGLGKLILPHGQPSVSPAWSARQ